MWRLSLPKPAGAACVAAVLSISDTVLAYRNVRLTVTGEVLSASAGAPTGHIRWDPVSDWHAVVMASAMLAGGVTLWWLLGALSGRAEQAGERTTAQRIRVLRLVVSVVWVAPYLVVVAVAVIGSGSFDPVWNDGLELVATRRSCQFGGAHRVIGPGNELRVGAAPELRSAVTLG